MNVYKGSQIEPCLEMLGQFRIDIFREYPYLYDGDMAYEAAYLQRYAQSQDGVLCLLLDEQGIRGACTGLPLMDEDASFQAPFEKHEQQHIFYIGEVMVRANARGQGLGPQLIKAMLDQIDMQRFPIQCLYTVDRGDAHPAKPAQYRAPDYLWQRFGFSLVPEKLAYFSWKDLGDRHATSKPMRVWSRDC